MQRKNTKFSLNRSIRSYTEIAIKNMKAELECIPREITRFTQEIDQCQDRLKIEEPKLRDLELQRLLPVQQQIKALDARLNVIRLSQLLIKLQQDIAEQTQLLNNLNNEFAIIKNILAPIDNEIELLNKLIEIKESQLAMETTHQQLSYHQDFLPTLEHEERTYQSKIREKKREIEEAQSKLTKLKFERSLDHYIRERQKNQSAEGNTHPENADFEKAIREGIKLLAEGVREFMISCLESKLSELQNELGYLEGQARNNSQELRRHEQGVSETRSKIRSLENKLQRYSYEEVRHANADTADSLKIKLHLKKEEKEPHFQVSLKLQQKIYGCTSKLSHLRNKNISSQRSLDNYIPVAKPFADNHDVGDLERQLEEQNDVQRILNVEKNQYQNEINKNYRHINSANQDIQQRRQRQHTIQTNDFLTTYWQYPERLLAHLKSSLRTQVDAYEAAYPAKQSVVVRLSIAEMERKLSVIQSQALDQVPGESAEAATKDLDRNKYYQVCGLLWNIIDRIEQSSAEKDRKGDQAFGQCVISALGKDSVAAHEAQYYYDNLRNNFRVTLQDMSEESFAQIEALEYDRALQMLKDASALIPVGGTQEIQKFRHATQHLITAIEALKQECDKDDKVPFDLKFYATLLNKAAQVVDNPGNADLLPQFKQLIEHNVEGKQSTSQRFGGGLLMFFGAATVIASALAKNFSGDSDLPSHLTEAGIATGSAAFLGGFGLFRYGRTKGTAKGLSDFSEAADKVAQSLRLGTQLGYDETLAGQREGIYIPIPSAP